MATLANEAANCPW